MENFKFTPKQWVLVRDGNGEEWCLAQFSNYSPTSSFGYTLCGGASFKCCIPFEGNEHLLGKMDDYVEPYVPKDGDFVTYTYNDGKYVAILSCKESDSVDCFYVSLCLGNKIEDLVNITTYNNRFQRYYIERRPSTEEEKQWLLDALHKDGKDWDAEKKEIVRFMWSPKYGEKYWYVDTDGEVRVVENFEIAYRDIIRINAGNCFQTKAEAEPYAEKHKEIFRSRWIGSK